MKKSVGKYFVELSLTPSKDKFTVKLFDKDSKNPTIEKSEVFAILVRKIAGEKKPYTTHLTCEPIGDHFECESTDGKAFQKGDQITLKTKRKGEAGKEITLSYPFQ